MKTLEMIKEIREEKRKELDLRVNRKTYFGMSWNRLYIIKIT